MNTTIGDSMKAYANFSIDVKRDEAMGVITTYILREICFHTSGIICPHVIWIKLNTVLNKINEGEVIHIEK